jgi:SAM-dependent methyltransferase
MAQSRSARQVFGQISDSRWLKILKRSIKESVVDGVHLPGFPAEELQRRTVGSSNDHTLGEAFAFYTYAKEVCARHGIPVRPGSEILDFGVSWGRIIRFFLKDVDPETLHGVDTNADFLGAARQTGIPGHLHQIDPLGRLPYAERSFDLVYAYSVFTHLPEHVQDHWLAEIARTLKPGTLLITTVEPPRFLDYFAPLDPEDKTLHPWHAMMARKIRADPGLKVRLQDSGFVYIPTRDDGAKEVYGDCVMTPAYVREHWGQWFEVIDYLDDPRRFWQAVVVARVR